MELGDHSKGSHTVRGIDAPASQARRLTQTPHPAQRKKSGLQSPGPIWPNRPPGSPSPHLSPRPCGPQGAPSPHLSPPSLWTPGLPRPTPVPSIPVDPWAPLTHTRPPSTPWTPRSPQPTLIPSIPVDPRTPRAHTRPLVPVASICAARLSLPVPCPGWQAASLPTGPGC